MTTGPSPSLPDAAGKRSPAVPHVVRPKDDERHAEPGAPQDQPAADSSGTAAARPGDSPQLPVLPASVVRPRERAAVLASLLAGVVPRVGFQHLQVGRAAEVAALTADLRRVVDGGSAVRFVIGNYGSGKSFLLNVVGAAARQHALVTVTADLNPDRRLQSSNGQAQSLYRELMRNLATRAQPEGGALEAVVERFLTAAREQADRTGGDIDEIIAESLRSLSELTGGYDFARVVGAYWRGYDTGNDQLRADAIRWLRAEFRTRTEAREALGVRSIIDDSSFYDSLKMLARFVRLAGFGGLLVNIDECVNLSKLAHTGSRNSNYEQILRIVNDCLQGSAEGLAVYFGGTPEFLTDTRRGLYSYDALRSRLSENTYATGGLVDHDGPVLRLANLTPEELLVLLGKLRHLQASGDPGRYLLPDRALVAFLNKCAQRLGDSAFRSPRQTIREFLQILSVLDQNSGSSWQDLVEDLQPQVDDSGSGKAPSVDNQALRSPARLPDTQSVDVPDSDCGAQASRPLPASSPVFDNELVTFRLTSAGPGPSADRPALAVSSGLGSRERRGPARQESGAGE